MRNLPNIGWGTAVLFLGLAACAFSQTGDAPTELEPEGFGPDAMRMEHLPFLKQAKTFQWSCFSHPSANSDDFYYPDPNAKGFKVFIDVKGPGSLNQWWSTGGMNKEVNLKFYFDNEKQPRIAATIAQLCGSQGPLGKADWPGINFRPLPFRERCVVTTDGPKGEEFHHMYAYTYPTAEGIKTHTGKEDYSEIFRMWENPGADPKDTRGNQTLKGKVKIPAGKSAAIYERKGQETIVAFKVDPDPNYTKLLTNLWVRAYWDGSDKPQIDAPITYLFGSADKGESKFSAGLPAGVRTEGFWYFYWPMPYWTSARIVLENRSDIDVDELLYEFQYKPKSAADYPKEKCGHLYGYFHKEEAKGPENYVVLETEGSGHVVAVVKGPGRLLENDEMVYIDDNRTPQFWGTGGEDYPLFCYGMRDESYALWGGTKDWRFYRYHIADTVNFHKHIRFTFEHGERHMQGWLKPNGDVIYLETLCLYYLNPVPNLVLTDELDVGNAASEKSHRYRAKGVQLAGKSKYAYQGKEKEHEFLEDDGKILSGQSEFRVSVNPANSGVRLRRRMVQTHIQEAKVYVDGREVVESRFYSPIHYKAGNGYFDTNQMWRDVEFEIPAKYTRKKKSLDIRIECLPPETENGGEWTEYYYWVYSYTRKAGG